MNTAETTPDSTTTPDPHHRRHDGGACGPRGGFAPGDGRGHNRGRGHGHGDNRGFGHDHGFAPNHGFGPHHGFAPHRDGAAFGPFAGARPKKGDIRLMKRVRRIAVELGRYRGTASKEQRAQAVAVLDGAIVEIKRILAS